MVSLKKDKKGFTLVELLLAMAVFSFVLTLCLAVFIQINRLYYRGISISKSQETARNLVTELTGRIQAGTVTRPSRPLPPIDFPGSTRHTQAYFCIGDVVYYYKLGVRASDVPAAVASNPAQGGRHVLARWTAPNFCTTAEPPAVTDFRVGARAVDLVDDNTGLYHFDVSSSQIELTIAYGNPNLIDPASLAANHSTTGDSQDIRCNGGRDVTFCGISQLETEVVTRTR